MPNFNTVVYTDQTTSKLLDISKTLNARWVPVTFTVPAGMVANDTITLLQLNKNEVLLPQSMVAFPALGASTAIVVGDGTTANAFLASTSTTSAGSATFNAGLNTRDLVTTATPVVATITGGNPTAASIIKVWLCVGRIA